ncbi:unnamed protein product [Candidula unifasciata]|uniref:C-type lectin domain-containing protein n=1 Tax=Candidula unifasciata TaxID=100452 RepID=A0A8S3Z7T7_9EUPU|nr:unnamed protein product [Candidula unifasciata]
MYNNNTQLCTPGKWLHETEAPPNTEEGALYLGYRCDTHLGFTVRSYNDTPVCILQFSTEVTYAEAISSCRSFNSYLYTTKTLDKFYLLQTLVTNWLWVGLDDIQTEGKLVWVDDGQELDPELISNIFSPGEPNDISGFEDCTEIFIGSLTLNDNICDKYFRYVCEQRM